MDIADFEAPRNYTEMDLMPNKLDSWAFLFPAGYGFTVTILQAALAVDKYYTPLLCLFGVLGNSISLVVFCMDSKYRRQSSSNYLCALAVSDSVFLLTLLAVWMETIFGGVITAHNFICSLVMYMGQVTCFISVYITVSFSLERYIAVYYPFSRPRLCTRSNAIKAIAGVGSTAMLGFSYAWWIAKVVEIPVYGEQHNQTNLTISDNNHVKYAYFCTVPSQFHKFSEIANYVDSAVTLLIPFLLITYFNVRIAVLVWRMNRERTNTTNITVTAGAQSCSIRRHSSKARVIQAKLETTQRENEMMRCGMRKVYNNDNGRLAKATSHACPLQQPPSSDVRVTKTLLLVSTVFLVLNLPLHVIRCTQFIIRAATYAPDFQHVLQALQPWANMMFNTNFAVNFLLYCLSGRNFRNSLRSISKRLIGTNRKKPDSNPLELEDLSLRKF